MRIVLIVIALGFTEFCEHPVAILRPNPAVETIDTPYRLQSEPSRECWLP